MSTGQAMRVDKHGKTVEPVGITVTEMGDKVYLHIGGEKRTLLYVMTKAEWRTATWTVENRQYGSAKP